MPQAVLHKHLCAQMGKLKFSFTKRHSDHRVRAGRILRPQFVGDKRNAAPLNLSIAGGVFNKILMTIPILGNFQHTIEMFII